MKLKTLVEYQRCCELLREAELTHKPLSGNQYVECIRAKSSFDYELKQHMDAIPEVEIEGATA